MYEPIDNQQQRIEDDLRWLGGIIDGEGCVTAGAGHTKTGHGHAYKHRRYIPLISIVNTDSKIMNKIFDTLSRAGIAYNVYTRTSKTHPTWKPKQEVMINGMLRVRKAIEILRPYVFSVKAYKMDMLYTWIQRRLGKDQKKEYDSEDYRMLSEIREASVMPRDYTPNANNVLDEDIVHATNESSG